MAGLFDTFTTGKRGLNVMQGAINTTAHNIANGYTEGYSRQRALPETTRPFGGMSRFDTLSVGQVGTGAQIGSIQRIRDTFIDYQVRSETGTSGYYSARSETLHKVEDIFAEPSDKGIQEMMSQFYSAFQEVSKSPNKSDVKTVAIQKASALADAINYAHNQLKKTCDDNQNILQTHVTDINSYLDQINELNKQIRGVSAVGQTPNDLMDKRDILLDKISSKFGLKVDKDKLETINLSSTEYPDNPLVKSDPNDVNYNRFSYVKNINPLKDTNGDLTGEINVEYYSLGNENAPSKNFTISLGTTLSNSEKQEKVQALVKDLNRNRIIVTDKDGNLEVGTVDPSTSAISLSEDESKKILVKTYEYNRGYNEVNENYIKGEIAGNQSVQAVVESYMKNLDCLAATLAYAVNSIQTGSLEDGKTSQGLSDNLIFVNDSNTRADGVSLTDTGINASNIKVNSNLIKDPRLLNCTTSESSGEGDGSRANAIANIGQLKFEFAKLDADEDLSKMDRKTFMEKLGIDTSNTGFKDEACLKLNYSEDGATADSYYKTMINNLAVITQEAGRQIDNQDTILANLEQQKLSVSGVSVDEEVTDMIKFQHAYQANARVISTINELLDVVINGLMR